MWLRNLNRDYLVAIMEAIDYSSSSNHDSSSMVAGIENAYGGRLHLTFVIISYINYRDVIGMYR